MFHGSFRSSGCSMRTCLHTVKVFIVGFAELEKKITPERIGCGTSQLLVLANVSRHTHVAPVTLPSDPRIKEGLQVVGALRDARERAEALDGLLTELLGYGQGDMAESGAT
mmetsp:Transcript_82237/g.228218  ORF Transcript_82237/g.228218 Transcript_82237/m.228218 type:complete len:111 (-) Transcript_82237:57-389(-)